MQQEPQAFTLFDRGKNDKTDKNWLCAFSQLYTCPVEFILEIQKKNMTLWNIILQLNAAYSLCCHSWTAPSKGEESASQRVCLYAYLDINII